MSTFAVPAVAWRGTEFTTRFTMDNAEAQHEVFALLDFAGRRFPVVFSHFSLNNFFNNKTRKGVNPNTSHSAAASFIRRSFHHFNQEVQTTSLRLGTCSQSFLVRKPILSFS